MDNKHVTVVQDDEDPSVYRVIQYKHRKGMILELKHGWATLLGGDCFTVSETKHKAVKQLLY